MRKLAERCEANLIVERFGWRDVTRVEQLPLAEAAKLPKGAIAVAELVAGKADIVNLNDRFYTKSSYTLAAERAQPAIGKKQFFGEVDHPDWEGTLRKAAAWYTELKLEGDLLVGTVAILNNEEGRHILSLLNADIPVEVSTRGYATSEEGTKYLPDGSAIQCRIFNDDLWFEGIDFVMHGANPFGKVTTHHESTKDKPMDLTKLKAEHPELVAALTTEARVGFVAEADVATREAAAKVAGAAEVTESPAFVAGVAAVAFQTTFLDALKTVLPADEAAQAASAAKITALESENTALKSANAVLESEKVTAADAAQKAEARAKIVAFVATTLEGYAQADMIRGLLEACQTEADVTAAFTTQKEQITKLETQIKAGLGSREGVADADDPTARGTETLDEMNRIRRSMGKTPLKALP